MTSEDMELVEATARRVVELLDQRSVQSAPEMVDAKTLAATLGVSVDFVYAHADELAGKRIGGGSKPRLRFDLNAALEGHQDAAKATLPVEQSSRSRRRQASSQGVCLLPVRGDRT
jgi:hypothetical protein